MDVSLLNKVIGLLFAGPLRHSRESGNPGGRALGRLGGRSARRGVLPGLKDGTGVSLEFTAAYRGPVKGRFVSSEGEGGVIACLMSH